MQVAALLSGRGSEPSRMQLAFLIAATQPHGHARPYSHLSCSACGVDHSQISAMVFSGGVPGSPGARVPVLSGCP